MCILFFQTNFEWASCAQAAFSKKKLCMSAQRWLIGMIQWKEVGWKLIASKYLRNGVKSRMFGRMYTAVSVLIKSLPVLFLPLLWTNYLFRRKAGLGVPAEADFLLLRLTLSFFFHPLKTKLVFSFPLHFSFVCLQSSHLTAHSLQFCLFFSLSAIAVCILLSRSSLLCRSYHSLAASYRVKAKGEVRGWE